MRWFWLLFSSLVLAVVSSSNLAGAAEVTPDVRRAAVLTTAAEAALSAAAYIQDRNGGKPPQASWSINFSERSFVLEMKDASGIAYRISGFLWGGDNEDWLVTFSGSGYNYTSKEPILINGKAVWKYDAQLSDHPRMDFNNVVKFGEHSLWGWVTGTELIVGGGVGAVGGVILGAPAGPPGMAAGGITGAIGTAGGAVAISDVAMRALTDKDPTPPPAPKPPVLPQKQQEIHPEKDMIIVAVVPKEGQIVGTGPGDVSLSGSFKGGTGTGKLGER